MDKHTFKEIEAHMLCCMSDSHPAACHAAPHIEV